MGILDFLRSPGPESAPTSGGGRTDTARKVVAELDSVEPQRARWGSTLSSSATTLRAVSVRPPPEVGADSGPGLLRKSRIPMALFSSVVSASPR